MSSIFDWETFCEAAKQLIAISDQLGDEWNLKRVKEEPGGLYLSKKTIVPVNIIQDETSTDSTETNDELQNSPQIQLLSYEYHVLYSLSYSVPVLYFNAYNQDGSLLKLEEIWARVPEIYKTQLENQKWSMLTQQEHPLMGRPFYMLHPCNTKELMAQVFNLNRNNSGQGFINANYLITFLSTVGPVVGLNLSTKYVTPCQEKLI